jgi:hypothetical protein
MLRQKSLEEPPVRVRVTRDQIAWLRAHARMALGLLRNRAAILALALQQPGSFLLADIAKSCGLTEDAVRHALVDLEKRGLIELVRTRRGGKKPDVWGVSPGRTLLPMLEALPTMPPEKDAD